MTSGMYSRLIGFWVPVIVANTVVDAVTLVTSVAIVGIVAIVAIVFGRKLKSSLPGVRVDTESDNKRRRTAKKRKATEE